MKNVHRNMIPVVLIVAVVLQLVIPAVSAVHPIVAALLMFLSIGCSLYVLAIWALLKGLRLFHTAWRKVAQIKWGELLIPWQILKHWKRRSLVPLSELEHLRSNIQRLGLALHGMTPEMEHARRTFFQRQGKTLPALVLPSHNAVLFAEFEGLVRLLNHFGFPFLENVRLHRNDFDFIVGSISNLELRVSQSQRHFLELQRTTQSALSEVTEVHQSLGRMYPERLNSADYQRLQGALELLQKMAQNRSCPRELLLSSIQMIQRDLDDMLKQSRLATTIHS